MNLDKRRNKAKEEAAKTARLVAEAAAKCWAKCCSAYRVRSLCLLEVPLLTTERICDQCLKLAQTCQNIQRPTDLIWHLEDEFSQSDAKLANFTELQLTEPDRCSVLLQAVSSDIRHYVLLHGRSGNWNSLCESLCYYEEQLRLCKPGPGGSSQSLNDTLCDHCGRRGHRSEQCWKKKRKEKSRNSTPR